jgi:tetratricopeptide (TPR) repeat protein
MSHKRKARRPHVAATSPLAPPAPAAREPAVGTQTRQWVRGLVPGLIALVTIAAFLPTLGNEFLTWDDSQNLVDNPHYRGFGWPHLRWMWTAFHMGHYIPLTWMTFGLDYLLWGLQPVGYHLTSLLLHATNAVVFYFVVRRLLQAALPGRFEHRPAGLTVSAACAALLFALHPLRVESVAWATERRDVLSGLFYLLAALLYLRACERGERGRGWYWAAVGVFACALLSKSMAVSLPVVLLILDAYPLRRLGGARGWWSDAARRVYLEKIPFFVLAGTVSAIAFLALARLHNMAPLEQLSVPVRLAISAYGLSFYLWKTVVPVNLSPLYELRGVNPWATPFLLSYGVVATLVGLAWALRRPVPGLAAAWLAFIVILFPVLGVFQNGPQIAADRYTYLAGLGWATLAGAGLFYAWPRRPVLLAGAAAGVLLALAALTWNQVRVWHDSQTLWTHALALDPHSPVAEHDLGVALARQGQPAAAIEHYRQALKLWPEYADAHYNWGRALAQQGKLTEAIEHYRQALTLWPEYADAHYNLGVALAQQGQPAEAIEHYRQVLKLSPDYADAHYRLGVALARQGNPAGAIEHYQQALRLKPDLADAVNSWGAALVRQGKRAEALERFQHALRLRPDFAAAHANLGAALAGQGRLAEATEHLQQALCLEPGNAIAHNNLGFVLARQGQPADAIEHYRRALHLEPDLADAHSNWGEALARQGKLAEAVEHYQQALRIKPDHAGAQAKLADALRRRAAGTRLPTNEPQE